MRVISWLTTDIVDIAVYSFNLQPTAPATAELGSKLSESSTRDSIVMFANKVDWYPSLQTSAFARNDSSYWTLLALLGLQRVSKRQSRQPWCLLLDPWRKETILLQKQRRRIGGTTLYGKSTSTNSRRIRRNMAVGVESCFGWSQRDASSYLTEAVLFFYSLHQTLLFHASMN